MSPHWRRQLIRLAVIALVLALWEGAFRSGLLSPIIFGSPGLIVNAAAQDGWTFLLAFRITVTPGKRAPSASTLPSDDALSTTTISGHGSAVIHEPTQDKSSSPQL